MPTVTLTVSKTGPADNITTFNSISAALAQANTLSDPVVIEVGAGTYDENPVISRSDISLVATAGRAATTISGAVAQMGPGSQGTVTLTGGANNVTIDGFTILGFDSANPGIEVAAVYIQGNHNGVTLLNNDIVANGEGGLLSEYAAVLSDVTVDHNIFSGQTFTGANPGIGDQWTVLNVPRQLVVLGGNGQNTSHVTFTNNEITGTAGGLTTGGTPSGNTLVTIDADDSVISDNVFTGFTNGNGWQLRIRESANVVSDNSFTGHAGGNTGIFTQFASGETPADISGTTLTGSSGADTILSSYGDDAIDGGDGNDVIIDLGGSDSIAGGGGSDRVVYAGPAADYDVTRNGDGSYTVTYTGTVAGLAGTDTLTGVDALSFAGQSYATELLAAAPSTAGYTERFLQDFAAGSTGISTAAVGGWYGSVTMVASGTGGVTSPSGSQHALLQQSGDPGDETGPFTRFDGYRADFGGGYATSVKIYLDTGMAAGEGFDYSVASANQSGNHLRDFVFHVTMDASTGTILIGADNGSTFDPRNDLENGNHGEVTTSGWYTFEHNFYENEDGDLEVAMTVYDAAGNWVFTEVRSDPSDDIATVVGGNRYGWFTNIDVAAGIQVDDLRLATAGDGDVRLMRGNVIFGEYATVEDAHAAVSNAADYIVDADGVFHVFGGMYLQAAINAAQAGATIMVEGGVLADTGEVTVNKQLTILGANEGLAGDDSGRGTESVLNTGATLNITAAGVIIDGMKFLGGGSVLGSTTAVYVGADDVTITNSVVEGDGSAYAGITTPYGGNVTGLVISGNLFTNWDSSAYFNPTTGVTITGNHFDATGSLNIGQLAPGSMVDGNEFTGSLGAPIAYDVMDSVEDVGQFIGATNTFDNGAARDVSIYVYGDGSAGTTVTGTGLADRFVTDYMTNMNSADTFFGGAGDDTIHGGGGADSISGGADNDLISGGAGDDNLDGGTGTDTLDVSDAGTGGAFVELDLGLTFSSAGGFDHAAAFENVRGSAGNDALFGTDGDNVFFASGGNDAIDGRDGADTFDASAATAALTVNLATESASGAHSGILMNIENVLAGSGNDSLTGSSGDNVLNGGAGDDRIAGGGGNDSIIGGSGTDTVVFTEDFDDATVNFSGMSITTATEGTDTLSGIERMVFADRTVFIVQAGESIQAAIDAAAAGDLIYIAAGTHVLPAQLNVNKAVELRGAGEGLTVIETAATSWGIYVTSDDVTLKGFSVDAGATTLYGVKVAPDEGISGPGAAVTGLTIDHLTISDSGRTELDLNRVDGATLSNLTLDGNGTAGNGLSMSASNHITVENLTTEGNLWGGVAIYPETSGPGWTDGSDDITFSGTLDLGEAQGLYIQESGSSAATNIEVEGWTDVYIVKNDTFRPGAAQFTFLFATEAEALAFATALPTPKDSVVTGPESNALPDTDLGSVFIVGPGMSIQAAIDAAQAGDTIQILEGTYAENITINKDGLTIIGIGDPEDIVIQGSFKADNGITGSVVDWIGPQTAYSNVAGNGVTVTSDGVTLDNLTIKGFYAGINLGNGIEGLTLDGVDVTEGVIGIVKATLAVVDDMTITGGSFTDLYQGIVIQKGIGGGKVDGLTITGTAFTHLGEKGIYLETGSNVLITGISMTDVGTYGRGDAFGNIGEWGTGIDVNLKYDDGVAYSNIVIEDFAMTNVGLSNGAGSSHFGGAAISIKARNDGPSYNVNSAAYTGQVIVRNGSIDTTSTGIRSGEPGKNLAAPGVTAVSGPPVHVENVTVSNASVGSGDNVSLSRMEVVLTGSDDVWTFNPATTGPVDVWGDAGNDGLGGGAGADNLFGGDGNDMLMGNAGGDTLTGGLGDDALIGGAGADVLNGGAGSDWASYAGSASGVTVNLLLGTASGGDAAGDTLALIENLSGSAHADTLTGDAGDNMISGGAGADSLSGGGGNDVLSHGDGDDSIDGGDGTDEVEFALDWSAYTITRSGSTYTVTGGGYTDVVTGVEDFTFNGTTISVATDPDAITSAAPPVIDAVTETGTDEDSDPDTIEVAEDAATGTAVATVSASDPNEAAGETLTYALVDSLGAAYTGPFAIQDVAGVMTIVTTGALDYEAADSHSFVLRVTDGAGHVTDQAITVGVLDVNEAPSSIDIEPGALSVDENAEAAIVTTVTSVDPDGDTLTWTTDDARFEVADIGGGVMALKLKTGQSLDAEAATWVTVYVTATDPDGLSSTRNVTFSVNDINEAPVVAGGLGVWTPGAVEAGLRRAVLTNHPTITDPEGGTLTYKLITAPTAGALWSGATQVALNAVLTQAEFDALTYAAPNTAGNRSAVFEVSDGTNTTALNVTLAVSAAVDGTYNGSGGADYLDGGAGNDFLRGMAGDDTVYGGIGVDILNGGAGNDTMIGGLGNDIYRVDSAGDVVVEAAGEGNTDTVTAMVDYTLAAGVSIERLYVHDLDSTSTPISLTGNELHQTIRGNLGDNTLDSGVGVGDRLEGGAGNDTYIVRNADDDVVEQGTDSGDVVKAAVSYALRGNAEIEVLRTIDDAATTAINLTGSAIGQSLIGNAGDNRLDGRGGNDILTGNAGADTFVFSTGAAPANAKSITDFVSGEDVIELSAAAFTGLTAGELDSDAFVVNTTGLAEGDEHRIIYNSATGQVLFDADGAGGAAARVFATLQLGATLTADDISIV